MAELSKEIHPASSPPGAERRSRHDHPARRRAPRRTGRRTQLTVPHAIWSELSELAADAGTTPNDILLRLATERLEQCRRELALQDRAEQRWRAFADATRHRDEASSTPLSEEELVTFAMSLREES
ncbi:MAG: hypothetical protein ACYCU0_15440 [Solirubrobacteraceae bacterium]